jgi:methylmalonyl-CoA mutase
MGTMSRIPNFADIAFEATAPAQPAGSAEPWLTPEGIPVKPGYSEADLEGIDFLNVARRCAYLRGPTTMYVNQPWTIRQYAGFSAAEDLTRSPRRNLAAGQVFRSPRPATHRGYDSDHPRVTGDIGTAGVIDSIYDMRTVPGILDQMSVLMTMTARCCPILALFVAAAEEGRSAGEIVGHHSERYSERVHGAQHLHLSAHTLDADHLRHFCVHLTKMPKYNSISISGYPMQEAGATQDLELAYTLADGVEYLRAGLRPARRRPLRAAAVILLGDRHELLRKSPRCGRALLYGC